MEARVDGAGQGQRIPASSWYALAVLSTISLFSYMDRTALSILLEPVSYTHLTLPTKRIV